MSGLTPFWKSTPARTIRSGEWWIPGERVFHDGGTYQHGPMFVEWQSPPEVTQPHPVVLVHGGTLQGTEWLTTPDGRPGWAQRLVENGFAVLMVDRPGHGRSPYHPDILGPPGPPFSYERAKAVYFADSVADHQTQWPLPRDDIAAMDAFIAPYGPIPADLAASQEMDVDRLARLLDRIGPSIIVTHSASGPDGWLLADRRPKAVVAIVAVEPMGPPFCQTPGFGPLRYGLTAAPLTFDPPCATPAEVQAADPASLRVPALAGLPVALVTGETSSFVKAAPAINDFLKRAGAAVERLHLPDHGITGNGHGLIYEKNSDHALQPVLRWLEQHAGTKAPSAEPISTPVTLYVYYRGNANTRFNREYYTRHHMALVLSVWKRYGLLSCEPLYPPRVESDSEQVLAICVCVFRDEAAINASFASKEASEVMADIARFTDAEAQRHVGSALS